MYEEPNVVCKQKDSRYTLEIESVGFSENWIWK